MDAQKSHTHNENSTLGYTMDTSDSATMQLIEYLDTHRIKWVPLELSVTPNGKKPQNYKRAGESGMRRPVNKKGDAKYMFNDDVYKVLQNEHRDTEYIWIDTADVTQIDIDGDTEWTIDAPYFESLGRKKPHYFISKSINNCADLVRVPAVSIISSIITTSFPLTSPIIVMSEISLAFFLCL